MEVAYVYSFFSKFWAFLRNFRVPERMASNFWPLLYFAVASRHSLNGRKEEKLLGKFKGRCNPY